MQKINLISGEIDRIEEGYMFKLWEKFKEFMKRIGFYFQITPNIDSLIKYAYSDSAKIRCKVATNINTPAGTLEKLAQDPVAEVRMAAVKNDKITDKALQILINDKNYDIRHIALEKVYERRINNEATSPVEASSALDTQATDKEKTTNEDGEIVNNKDSADIEDTSSPLEANIKKSEYAKDIDGLHESNGIAQENEEATDESNMEFDEMLNEMSEENLNSLEESYFEEQNVDELIPDEIDIVPEEKVCDDFHYIVEACEKIKNERAQQRRGMLPEQNVKVDRSNNELTV